MQELWQANGDLAVLSLFHPFVLALAQGTLPKAAFQGYVAEDAFFLKSFAKGYDAAYARVNRAGLSAAKASAASTQLRSLRDGCLEELSMHDAYAAKWGIDHSSHMTPAPATKKYIDFLLDIIEDPEETVAGVLAAMVPCLRLYAYLGCTLSAAFSDANHAYVEWLHTYRCHAYVRLPAIAELLLDEIGDQDNKGKSCLLLLT